MASIVLPRGTLRSCAVSPPSLRPARPARRRLLVCGPVIGSSARPGDRASSAGALTRQRTRATLTNWPTYHRTTGAAGVAAASITLPLHPGWTANLDGAVYGEPLVVNGTLIVATENDSVYGLSPTTGHQKWRTHLGDP